MNVFIDTEFSGLGSDPRLISIALVTDSGAELYIEFASGWEVAHCSRWVIEHVLPQLGNGEQLDRLATSRRIDTWLSDFDPAPALIVDSGWDAELIANLLTESGIGTAKYAVQIVRFSNKTEAERFAGARQRFLSTTHRPQHHALSDALALRFAWNALG